MYCTNCGRKLPEDGSPCVCRQQPAQPEQQTYTQPVQPQQNYGAPAQNFQAPPQYYAQPPVQYPVQPPTSMVTPVHGVLKSFFASPLFLITAILFSANLLFQIIANLIPQDPAYIVNQIYSNLPYEMQFIISPGDLYSALSDAQSGTTIGTVIGMLISGGLMAAAYWVTYISAKNPSIPAAKTAGLTIMKVFSIISLVVLSLAEVLCVVLAVIFGVALAGNDYGYMMSVLFLILIVACIIGFVVLIFEIIYEAKVIKMLNSAKNAMLTGMVPNKASMFVAVICFISAAVSFFSVFGDAVLYGWIRVPLGLTSVALNVLHGLLVLRFNKMLKNAGMAR